MNIHLKLANLAKIPSEFQSLEYRIEYEYGIENTIQDAAKTNVQNESNIKNKRRTELVRSSSTSQVIASAGLKYPYLIPHKWDI